MNDFIHNTHHDDDDDDDSHSEIESSSPTMQLPLIDKMTTAIVNTLPSVDNQVHESVLLGVKATTIVLIKLSSLLYNHLII